VATVLDLYMVTGACTNPKLRAYSWSTTHAILVYFNQKCLQNTVLFMYRIYPPDGPSLNIYLFKNFTVAPSFTPDMSSLDDLEAG
jgi:hypothetical protein